MPFTEAWKTFPELKTKRLALRQIDQADAAAYYRGISTLPHNSTWPQAVEAKSIEASGNAIRIVSTPTRT